MKQPMKNPEQPKENPVDLPKEQKAPEVPREREVVVLRATVIENTRKQLDELARRLPRIEGARQDRFAA